VDGEEWREPTLDDWLIVPKWGRFQHYKDRHPTWIKVYARLLQDPNYLGLSLASRGLLLGIWLAYSQESGQLSVKNLGKILGTSISKVSLISLNHAGFLLWSASKPLAAKTEIEKEREETEVLETVENQRRPAAAAYKPFKHDQLEPLPIEQALEVARALGGQRTEEIPQSP
jgi:hypothetical protein